MKIDDEQKSQRGNPEIMTIKEMAEYLRIGERSAYKLARRGVLPAFKIVNKWRFDRDLVQAFVRKESIGGSI